MHFSSKFNAQRGAKRAGHDPATLEFVRDVEGKWTWLEPVRCGPIDGVIGCAHCGIGSSACMCSENAERLPPAFDPLATLRNLVEREQGATVEEIAEATGLSKETAHAKITSELKKRLGLKVDSSMKDRSRGGRIYRALGEAAEPQFPFFFQGAAHEAHA